TYLADLLVGNRATHLPKVHALLALMLFQAARLAARTRGSGELVLLEEQDRSLWDRSMIARAFAHLDASAAGDEMTVYHAQAAIAALHAAAPSLEATDWAEIVSLYDTLAEIQPSPVVLLNRAVAIARRDSASAGLSALDEVRDHPAMRDYYLYHAVH